MFGAPMSSTDRDPQPRFQLADWIAASLWVVCAMLTLPAARAPGLVPDPNAVPYPWAAVVETWILLAFQAALLRVILRPARPGRIWIRLLACVAGVTLVLLSLVQLGTTDFPGYTYMPALFSVMAALIVCILGIRRGITWLRARQGPGEPHAA